MNIRFKITLLFTLLVMGILSLVSYSVYYFTEQSRQAIFKQRLQASANNRANLFALLGDNKLDVLQKMDSSSTVLTAQRALIIYDDGMKPAYEFYGSGAKIFVASPQQIASVKLSKTIFLKMGSLDV